MDTKWNKNGNWLLTASRDHLIKLFDIRNISQEMQTFRGHKKEATSELYVMVFPFEVFSVSMIIPIVVLAKVMDLSSVN